MRAVIVVVTIVAILCFGGLVFGATVSQAMVISPSEMLAEAAASIPAAARSPGTTAGSGMVYDAADQYVVLFNGTTWIFDNGVWTHPSLAQQPGPRTWECFAYDWATGYAVLFGGASGFFTPAADDQFNDTWTFHAGVWTNITASAHGPPNMGYPACAYDPVTQSILLFGGAVGENPNVQIGTSGKEMLTSNQTWEFSAGVWTNITSYSAPHPSSRFGAAMAWDSVDDYMVMYGGAINETSTGESGGTCDVNQCPHYNQTWTWSDGVWTNISASASVHGTPPGRCEVALTNDTRDGYLVSFGGQDDGWKSENATGDYTWTFVGGVWSNISSQETYIPPTRFGASITYDPVTDDVVMFSGHGGTLINQSSPDDTLYFTNGQWELILVANTLPPSVPSFSDITASGVTVSWIQGQFVDDSVVVNNTVLVGVNYTPEKSPMSPRCTDLVVKQSTNGPATSAVVTGLAAGFTYCVLIQMWNGTLREVVGHPVSFTTSTGIPPGGGGSSQTGCVGLSCVGDYVLWLLAVALVVLGIMVAILIHLRRGTKKV